MQKKSETNFFFSSGLFPISELWPFEKNMDEIFAAKYLKTNEARVLKPSE